jgi:hypothetical protein
MSHNAFRPLLTSITDADIERKYINLCGRSILPFLYINYDTYMSFVRTFVCLCSGDLSYALYISLLISKLGREGVGPENPVP